MSTYMVQTGRPSGSAERSVFRFGGDPELIDVVCGILGIFYDDPLL